MKQSRWTERGGEFLGGAGERQAEEVSREVSDLSQNPKIKELAKEPKSQRQMRGIVVLGSS